jgi:hypothetical protein
MHNKILSDRFWLIVFLSYFKVIHINGKFYGLLLPTPLDPYRPNQHEDRVIGVRFWVSEKSRKVL